MLCGKIVSEIVLNILEEIINFGLHHVGFYYSQNSVIQGTNVLHGTWLKSQFIQCAN